MQHAGGSTGCRKSAGGRRDNNILDKKVQGFQDPKTSCRMADLYPNVDHVLVGNGTVSPLSAREAEKQI